MKRITYLLVSAMLAAVTGTDGYAQSFGSLRRGSEAPAADSIRVLFAGGDGTASDPLQIADARQMVAFLGLTQQQVGQASFALTRSLDFKRDLQGDESFIRDKDGRVLLKGIDYFAGIFDGREHSLSGFVLTGGASSASALFCKLYGAKVTNLTIRDAAMVQSEESQQKLGEDVGYAGIIAGSASDLTADNCHVQDVTISCSGRHMSNIGAIVGWGSGCRLTNVSAKNVRIAFEADDPVNYTPSGVGLLVGYAENSHIGDSKVPCVATGSILVDVKDASYLDPQVGGAVGRMEGSAWLENIVVGGSDGRTVVEYNHNSAVLMNTGVGGLIGFVRAEAFDQADGDIIDNCRTYADVKVGWTRPGPVGNNYESASLSTYGCVLGVGGFIGTMVTQANVDNSASYGNVTLSALTTDAGLDGIAVGGFVGNLYDGKISRSAWYGKTVSLSVPEGWEDDHASQIGEYIAVGGFAGAVGDSPNDPTDAQLWKCRVGLPSDYAASPKITRQMRFDSYAFGLEPLEQMQQHYIPANLADPNVYAHRIDAAISPTKLVVAFNDAYGPDYNGTGGFVGFNCGRIDECYAESVFVTGMLRAGGFVGSQYSRFQLNDEDAPAIWTKKCSVRDVYVCGTNYAGGFAGQAFGGYTYDPKYTTIPSDDAGLAGCRAVNINNVEVKPSDAVSSTVPVCIGGFVGRMDHLVIENCEAVVTIGIVEPNEGVTYTGGFAGLSDNGAIDRCLALGAVSVAHTENVGGLVGSAGTSRVNRSLSVVHLYCDSAEGVGGIVGLMMDGSIKNSCVLGAITPYGDCDNHGGIAGFISTCDMNNCYAAGPVQLVNKPGQVLDLVEAMVGLASKFIHTTPEIVSVALKSAVIVVDLIKVVSNVRPKGNAGGIAGDMDNVKDVSKYRYTYWDKFVTTQSNACKAYPMKSQALRTKELIQDFEDLEDTSEGESSWSNRVLGYYVPFDAESLFTSHLDAMKKAGFAQ